jgi:hypothetical protein
MQPRKPPQNGHIESFKGRLRHERLNVTHVLSTQDAREQIADRFQCPLPTQLTDNLTRGECETTSDQQDLCVGETLSRAGCKRDERQPLDRA